MSGLLGDLGRPTRRGVRKCPQCGTMNGTRGLSCKNRRCDMLFKAAVRKRGVQAATKLIVAGSEDDIFSVKLKSRSTPEQRGFVRVSGSDLSMRNGRCLTCNLGDCVHVAACLQGDEAKESVPLAVKHSVLNNMSISADWKHKIWLRARDSGPLAQRVSATTVSFEF